MAMKITISSRALKSIAIAGVTVFLLVTLVGGANVWAWFSSHRVPIARGSCVFPESWSYHTITTWSDDATYCVRLAPGESVMHVTWSDNRAVIGLFIGSGPMVTQPAGNGMYTTEPDFHAWRIIDARSNTITELPTATGGLELSPDGSRAITGQCGGAHCYDVVLDVPTGNKLCEFEVYASWHERGCEGIVQADGQYWDIKAKVNLRACEAHRLYGGSYPDGCENYVDVNTVVP